MNHLSNKGVSLVVHQKQEKRLCFSLNPESFTQYEEKATQTDPQEIILFTAEDLEAKQAAKDLAKALKILLGN